MAEVAKRGKSDPKILDVGCGSGWLARELKQYGQVTATDLSQKVINDLQRKEPGIEWIGDFLSVTLPENYYDIVICLETIAHVPDQEAFVQHMARVIQPGGTVLLTSQNEYVWLRTSSLQPPEEGQIRNWPSRDRLRELFTPYFSIEKIVTCAPGGDRGLPRLINNRVSNALGSRFFGQTKWVELCESWGWGVVFF